MPIIIHSYRTNRPRGYITFSCSTQLSIKFELLTYTEVAKINGNFNFESPKPVSCWNFNIYEQDKFHAQLS